MSSDTTLRAHFQQAIQEKSLQGYDISGIDAEMLFVPDSYDDLIAFARELTVLPHRPDWRYTEPDDLEAIHAESYPSRALGKIGAITPEEAVPRVRTAFLASICGCILGKPVEFNPTLGELETMLSAIGEWPITDYLSEKIIPATISRRGSPMPYWNRVYRDQIEFVMPDDDINYTLLGMLLLEAYGKDMTTEHVRAAWLRHLTAEVTVGPERSALVDIALKSAWGNTPVLADLTLLLSGGERRGDAHCGAQIRADAYGYACPGQPALAADLAYQDAVLTHRGTGLYATLWTAAAIAVAFTEPDDPLEIFRVALQYVPQRSRFYEAVSVGLEIVAKASDWRTGYEAIHAHFPGCGHCGVYQESVTLINTLRFARHVDEGFCMQVMQGNDTDSYGATAGSLLGAYLGPGMWQEDKWLAPFQDDLHTGLSWFFERSLSEVAHRISRLPLRLASGDVCGYTTSDLK